MDLVASVVGKKKKNKKKKSVYCQWMEMISVTRLGALVECVGANCVSAFLKFYR